MTVKVDESRVKELRDALSAKAQEIKDLSSAWKDETGNGQFSLTSQQVKDYRKAVEDADEIKGLIALEEKAGGIFAYLDAPEGTPASAQDAVGAELARWRLVPDFRFVADYHAEPRYIEALARSVESHWQVHGSAERLVLSFHGIPQRYFRNGDPYFCQCQATARALRERLDLREDDVIVSFQSRVGREPWLKPYTDHVLEAMPREGVKRVQVLCPGFAIDCLETLEEIAITNREQFLRSGGERFEYIPALNATPAHVAALAELVLKQTQGWPELDPGWDNARVAAQRASAEARYRRLRDAGR